jgi:CrcB protein
VTVLLVLLGGAVGAPARYLTDLAVQGRHGGRFPWGTLSVNVAGSLVLGVTAGAVSAGGGPAWVLTLVGTGFCGALTTFSSFGFETIRLLQERSARAAIGNVTLSVAAGLGACALGWWVGSAVAG